MKRANLSKPSGYPHETPTGVRAFLASATGFPWFENGANFESFLRI
jgi:hypothetical protein